MLKECKSPLRENIILLEYLCKYQCEDGEEGGEGGCRAEVAHLTFVAIFQ